MIVLDASATIEWLLRDQRLAPLVDDVLLDADSVHVPHVWMLEVVQVLRRHEAADRLPPGVAATALVHAQDLPAVRHGHDELVPRIWQLRHNLTAYDAAYVALAEVLDATLVTTDTALANAPGNRARTQLLR